MQVQLYPGWQFTKRTYDGKPLGHYYISGSQASINQSPTATVAPAPVTPALPTPNLPETVITAPEPPANPGSTVTETETEIIIKQNDQSNAVVEQKDVTPKETEVIKEPETVIIEPAPVVTPPRRSSPTPADFRRFR
jgi:hypothetical protein